MFEAFAHVRRDPGIGTGPGDQPRAGEAHAGRLTVTSGPGSTASPWRCPRKRAVCSLSPRAPDRSSVLRPLGARRACCSPSPSAQQEPRRLHPPGRAAADRGDRGARRGRSRAARAPHLRRPPSAAGVSEILYTLIPLMNDVGIEAEWQVMLGREEFFNVTKRIHNALQGNPDALDRGGVGDLRALQRAERRASCTATRTSSSSTTRSRRAARAAATTGNAGPGSGAATSTSRRPTRAPWSTSALSSTTTTPRSSPRRLRRPRAAIGAVELHLPPAIDPLSPKNMALSPRTPRTSCRPVSASTSTGR